MAFGEIGSRTDHGWGQGIYEAYLYITDKYPEIDASFTDEIPWADFPTWLELQGEKGVQLLYTDSAQTWGEAMDLTLPNYPDMWHATPGSDAGVMALRPENSIGMDYKAEWNGFLLGVVAGMMTETDTIGYVTGLDYPEITRLGAGYEWGAKWVNPDVESLHIWTMDWNDSGKAYESTMSLIDAGADVIVGYFDGAGLGVISACEDAGVWRLGWGIDQYAVEPSSLILTGFLTGHWLMADQAVQEFKAGTLSHRAVMTPEVRPDEWEFLAPFTNTPADVEALVAQVERALRAGLIGVPVMRGGTELGHLSIAQLGIMFTPEELMELDIP
jgi:basic membrane protein A